MQSFPYLQDLTNRSTMFTMEIALLIERCKQGDEMHSANCIKHTLNE